MKQETTYAYAAEFCDITDANLYKIIIQKSHEKYFQFCNIDINMQFILLE